MAVWSAFALVMLCTGMSLVQEGITWLLLYRTVEYRSLTSTIERANKRLETLKKEGVAATRQKGAKKESRTEAELNRASQELQAAKLKSNVIVGFTFFAMLYVISRVFKGMPVAKLPFTPIALLRGITHRGLVGEDFTDCSATFICVMCNSAIRPNVQKLLGFKPPTPINQASGFLSETSRT